MDSAAFDAYAQSYDHHFTNTAVGKLQRARVRSFFSRYVSGKKNILEVNCGTGEDAVWLACSGHSVLATDVSSHMIKIAESKADNKKIANLEFQQCHFRELGKFKNKKFDLLFSNFGGLNCVSPDQLRDISSVFSELVNKNGVLFLVIMGRKCRWEKFYFRQKNEQAKANRRLSTEAVQANVNGEKVDTWYFSPSEISSAFSAHFKTIATRPVGLFIPPSYLDNYFAGKKILLSMLNVLEKLFGNIQSFSDHADHYLIILEKK